MKVFNYIICLFIGFIAFPVLGKSQCRNISETLFLQAPDSICAGTKDLVIKASRVVETNVKYVWRTPKDTIVTMDSVLRIANPSAIHSGNYFVAIRVDTCQTAFFGPINVQVIGTQKTKADTIKMVQSCNSSEITLSSVHKISNGVTGKWIGTEGVVFAQANAPTTLVKGLKEGENWAIWMLSTAVCPFFIKDTFNVRYEVAPKLETDGLTLKAGEASKTIALGQVAGSNLNTIRDVSIIVTKPPKNGVLEILNDGKRLKYNRSTSFNGRDAFEIKVCNLRCPNLCSAAIHYTVDVFFDERYPNVTIPKMLAPKDLGASRVFNIEKVEDYPENELTILNRWGNRLLTFTNYKNTSAWDGNKNNGLLPSGAYYYLFYAKDPKGAPLKPLNGIFYIVY